MRFESGRPVPANSSTDCNTEDTSTALHFPPIIDFLPQGMRTTRYACGVSSPGKNDGRYGNDDEGANQPSPSLPTEGFSPWLYTKPWYCPTRNLVKRFGLSRGALRPR